MSIRRTNRRPAPVGVESRRTNRRPHQSGQDSNEYTPYQPAPHTSRGRVLTAVPIGARISRGRTSMGIAKGFRITVPTSARTNRGRDRQPSRNNAGPTSKSSPGTAEGLDTTVPTSARTNRGSVRLSRNTARIGDWCRTVFSVVTGTRNSHLLPRESPWRNIGEKVESYLVTLRCWVSMFSKYNPLRVGNVRARPAAVLFSKFCYIFTRRVPYLLPNH